MTKNVGILIFNDAEVLDFAGPFEVFSVTSQINDNEPFNVFMLTQDGGMISAVNGLKVVPDYSIKNHPPIDILIVSGGQGTRALLNNSEILSWLKQACQTTEITLSICSGCRLIGKLGLLDNKPFCTHHQVYEHMLEIAPSAIPMRNKRFTQSDEHLYTSGGISAGIDLSFHVVANLLGENLAAKTAQYMEYHYQPQPSEYEQIL